MRTRTKRRIIPLALALALAMIGAALAVPYIQVTVQGIGAGDSTVYNPIVSTKVTWKLSSSDPDVLENIVINVTSSKNLSTDNGHLIIKFYDSDGNLVYTDNVSVSSLTWTQTSNGDYWATVNLGTSITLDDGTTTKTITFGTTKLEDIFTSTKSWINEIAVIYQGAQP